PPRPRSGRKAGWPPPIRSAAGCPATGTSAPHPWSRRRTAWSASRRPESGAGILACTGGTWRRAPGRRAPTRRRRKARRRSRTRAGPERATARGAWLEVRRERRGPLADLGASRRLVPGVVDAEDGPLRDAEV